LLTLLIWLHDRMPPLVHRDIKPSNLILTPDQQLYLIDFGSVLQHLKPQGGSTVAGTFGYMAPEQLSGRALPASDLYGVGASLIHLLSGKAPGELPQERLWIRFEAYVQISAPLQRWIKTLINPVLEERCENARQALATLEKALRVPEAPVLGREMTAVQTAVGPNLALLKDWPIPVPETGMPAIEVQKVPQGVSILLPRRESTQSGKYFLNLNLGLWAVATALYLVFKSRTDVFIMSNYFFQFLAISAGFGMSTYYRHQRLSSRQTHLTLAEGKLIVHFSDKAKSHQIPWSNVSEFKQLRRGRGIQLKYQDAKTGKRKRLRLGHSLEAYEQYWLYGILEDYKNSLSMPD
jgi:serine/threonine protein kinase